MALNQFKGVRLLRPEEYVKSNYPEFFEAAVPVIKVFDEGKHKLGINPAPRTVAAAAVYIVSNKSQKEIGKKFHTTMQSMRKSLQIFNELGLSTGYRK